MRRVPFAILLVAMVVVVAACGSPAASQGEPDQSTDTGQPSEAGQASEGAQPSQGGGGGGGGANGSITYQITGDVEKSGEVPFQAGGMSSYSESEGGWVANFVQSSGEGAYILLNTFSRGQILTYGDGEHIIAVGSDEATGYDCTFTLDQNDASGLAGSMSCNDVPASLADSSELLTVDISAEWNAHN